MGYLAERIALQSKFNQGFVLQNPVIQIAWEGVNFNRPNADISWISLVLVNGGDTRQVTCGSANPTFRNTSIMQFNINVPANNGTAAAEQIADQISDLFFTYEILVPPDGIITPKPSYLKSLGVRDGKYIAILSIPYQRDVYKGKYMSVLQRTALTGAQDGDNSVFVLSMSPSLNPVNSTVDGVTTVMLVPNLMAFLNGVLQPANLYSVLGSQVTFNTAPKATDTLEFLVW